MDRYRRRRPTRQGFTLMEVLLVLVILVILGSMATMFIRGASRKARAKAARTHATLLACDSAWDARVTVNTLAPGPVPPLETLEAAVAHCQHGSGWRNRETTCPQDIAEGVAFLCSEAGDFISGAALPYRHRAP